MRPWRSGLLLAALSLIAAPAAIGRPLAARWAGPLGPSTSYVGGLSAPFGPRLVLGTGSGLALFRASAGRGVRGRPIACLTGQTLNSRACADPTAIVFPPVRTGRRSLLVPVSDQTTTLVRIGLRGGRLVTMGCLAPATTLPGCESVASPSTWSGVAARSGERLDVATYDNEIASYHLARSGRPAYVGCISQDATIDGCRQGRALINALQLLPVGRGRVLALGESDRASELALLGPSSHGLRELDCAKGERPTAGCHAIASLDGAVRVVRGRADRVLVFAIDRVVEFSLAHDRLRVIACAAPGRARGCTRIPGLYVDSEFADEGQGLSVARDGSSLLVVGSLGVGCDEPTDSTCFQQTAVARIVLGAHGSLRAAGCLSNLRRDWRRCDLAPQLTVDSVLPAGHGIYQLHAADLNRGSPDGRFFLLRPGLALSAVVRGKRGRRVLRIRAHCSLLARPGDCRGMLRVLVRKPIEGGYYTRLVWSARRPLDLGPGRARVVALRLPGRRTGRELVVRAVSPAGQLLQALRRELAP